MAKVFLGVGHGGADPGAIGNGFNEKDLNLSIALACQKELVRHGVTVAMSRTKDENDTLAEEIKECNAFAPDLAVDVHNNAGGGDGWEAYVQTNGYAGKSRAAAAAMEAEVKKLGQNSRGIKTKKNSAGTDWFGWLRQVSAPAVLVECAFVDTKDVQIIDTEAEREAMGKALARGILTALGVSHKPEGQSLYRVQVGAYAVRGNAEHMLEKLRAEGFSDAYIRES